MKKLYEDLIMCIITFVSGECSGRLISRTGALEWPPRSQDQVI